VWAPPAATDANVTVDITGAGMTETVALPVFPSDVAVTVAEPAATPVTIPVVETVATSSPPDSHTTERPASALPD
jgi:hypothetical protein